MVNIENVIIFGDSLSDIGGKWRWPSGELGRLFGAMRVNETGRFSDGKNWTDFLVEWATGEALMWGNADLTIDKSTEYRSLSYKAVLGVPRIRYVNYSMGGCIVTRDWTWPPKFGALTNLREQVEDYIRERGRMGGTAFKDKDPTLHIIWVGLNDFVTLERPDYTHHKLKHMPSEADYDAWRRWAAQHPDELSNGVGVYPAVAEVQSLVEMINRSFPEGDHHFMLVDLPSVYHAIRYMEGLGEHKKVKKAELIDPVTRHYNEMLQSLVFNWPDTPDAPAEGRVHLVRMSLWMDYISEHLEEWGLHKQAQDPSVPPFYQPGVPPSPKKDPVPRDMRRRITTSDLGHPTEAVYCIMARYFVTRMLKLGYTLGRLDEESWAEYAPYKDLQFDVIE